MKSLRLVAMAVALAVATASELRPDAGPPPRSLPRSPPPAATPAANPQQERMKVCNEKATGMKGDERKDYMSACLAGKEPEKPLTAQQQRMTDCNKKAGGHEGRRAPEVHVRVPEGEDLSADDSRTRSGDLLSTRPRLQGRIGQPVAALFLVERQRVRSERLDMRLGLARPGSGTATGSRR